MPDQRGQAVTAFAAYIDAHYSSNCSVFRLKTNITLDPETADRHHHLVTQRGFCPVRQQEAGLPCTHILPLAQPFEKEIWPKWAPNIRKRVRRAGETGVNVIVDRRLEYIDDFTSMLAHLFRRHGSVPLGRKEVEMRLRTFEGRTKVFIALLDARPVAAQLCYYTPTTCYLSKMPSYPEAHRRNITMLLYATVIRDACESGFRYVEFGVTDDAGNEAYKAHFRGTRIPLGYYEKTYSSIHRYVHYVGGVSKTLWNQRLDLSRMSKRRA
jgi:lipid II:glycine glycyltransferase (peptidoglycan interpeptide bridge formation enzyme)